MTGRWSAVSRVNTGCPSRWSVVLGSGGRRVAFRVPNCRRPRPLPRPGANGGHPRSSPTVPPPHTTTDHLRPPRCVQFPPSGSLRPLPSSPGQSRLPRCPRRAFTPAPVHRLPSFAVPSSNRSNPPCLPSVCCLRRQHREISPRPQISTASSPPGSQVRLLCLYQVMAGLPLSTLAVPAKGRDVLVASGNL